MECVLSISADVTATQVGGILTAPAGGIARGGGLASGADGAGGVCFYSARSNETMIRYSYALFTHRKTET